MAADSVIFPDLAALALLGHDSGVVALAGRRVLCREVPRSPMLVQPGEAVMKSEEQG